MAVWRARIRLFTGLVLVVFLTLHLINHAAGLWSVAAMDALRPWLVAPWNNLPGLVILAGSLILHVLNALYAIYRRSTLNVARWEGLQISLGLAALVLMAPHIAAAAAGQTAFGYSVTYEWLMVYFWAVNPTDGVLQAVAMLVAWSHGMIGLHYWLRVKTGYAAWFPYLLAIAVAIPVAALGGFIAGGIDSLRMAAEPGFIDAAFARQGMDAEASAVMNPIVAHSRIGAALVILLPFVLRGLRIGLGRLSRAPALRLPQGRSLRVRDGETVLETLRSAGIPHAAVCGGRGRCTTCRIRIVEGLESLETENEIEKEALTRIAAPPGVRLACQLRPRADLSIMPLLPPRIKAGSQIPKGGLDGQERSVTFLFVDLRTSTRLGETKLPYDVLYILNQFFAEMTAALRETRGHYAQFNGDGLMAIYGLKSRVAADGVRDALAGAQAMVRRVDALNQALKTELPFPLTVGIGIHHGEAIVGTMGPPDAQIVSAIGDAVNTAARLEALSKEHGNAVVIALSALEIAGIGQNVPDDHLHNKALRGREGETRYAALPPDRLGDILKT